VLRNEAHHLCCSIDAPPALAHPITLITMSRRKLIALPSMITGFRQSMLE